jgi:4-amino-4-deoxy-L-arabinose transferase-like glycosyltransferase
MFVPLLEFESQKWRFCMSPSCAREVRLRAEIAPLVAIALCLVVFHIFTNGKYGFHKDELAAIDDAHFLAWGYVAYPPVTPFLGRVAFELFGNSLRGFRFFPALAQGIVVFLSGLMAHELGGKRFAQLVAALAVAIAPVSLAGGTLLQYVTFDYMWWVLVAFLLIRLLRTQNEHLWLAIGGTIGLGMMTKYTMIFLVGGIVVGVLLTDARHYLKSRWLWFGVGLSLLIFLPNRIWQMQHHFVSLDFLQHIHARDVHLGRARNFLPEQFFIAANLVTLTLWLSGLRFYFITEDGKPYRVIGWAFLVPLVLFIIARGRSYYMAPGYPMLLAAGAAVEERWISSLSSRWSRLWRVGTFAILGLGGVLAVPLLTPIAPLNSWAWNVATKLNENFKDEIGWPELAAEVARIRNTLPAEELTQLGILVMDYGDAGAIDLYGSAYGLPKAISGVNSYWWRGYGDPPPQTLIVVGFPPRYAARIFEHCEVAGSITNTHGVGTGENEKHSEILVCRNLRQSWPEFWKTFQYYG